MPSTRASAARPASVEKAICPSASSTTTAERRVVEARAQALDQRHAALAQLRVAVGLHQVRTGEVEDVAVALGELRPAARDRDRDHQVLGRRQRERDLVAQPHRHEDLAVELQRFEVAARDHVREAVGAAVTRAHEALVERVLRGVARPARQLLLGHVRVADRRHRHAAVDQLVVGGEVRGQQAAQRGHDARAELGQVLGVVGLADEVQDCAHVAFGKTTHGQL